LVTENGELRTELATARERLNAMTELEMEVNNLKSQCITLEESLGNKLKVADELQSMTETVRSQGQAHVDQMHARHAEERAEWEARAAAQLEAAQQDSARELETFQKELKQKQQDWQEKQLEYEEKLQKLEAATMAAEGRATQANFYSENRKGSRLSQTPQMTPTGGQAVCTPLYEDEAVNFPSVANTPAAGDGPLAIQIPEGAPQNEQVEEMQQQMAALEEQAADFAAKFEQEHLMADAMREKLEDFKEQLRSLCAKHCKGSEDLLRQSKFDILGPLDTEIQRLKDVATRREADAKALHEQVTKQQDEASTLRSAKNEAEDRCMQLQADLQEAQGKSMANTLKLEEKLKDSELTQKQELLKAQSEAEAHQKAREAAEAISAEMQPKLDKLNMQLQRLEEQFADEQKQRKKLHNQILDMKGTIRVFCRFRPMVKRETEAGDIEVLKRADAFTARLQRGDESKPFQFDSVFNTSSTQEDVFADCRELVQSAVDGYNVTIFAYGQTGAGKTHTMYGSSSQPGLAPRAIHEVFNVINRESKQGKSFKVKAYMVEVYKQDILDLLAPDAGNSGKAGKDGAPEKKKGLDVKRDMGHGIVYVDGVTELSVKSPEELKAAMAEGEKKRHVTATKMNSASSRSHLLLTVIIEGTVKETGQVFFGKITLCDLAGSERPKKSEVSGEALKEAIEINKSLSALGDVIEALTKGSKSIPYRNHKLTMLMQDSLGGTAKTLMFVNCSPAGSNYEETLMSLKWATRARQVTNDVKRNADNKEVARLKQVIAMMSQAQNAQEAPMGTPADVGNLE